MLCCLLIWVHIGSTDIGEAAITGKFGADMRASAIGCWRDRHRAHWHSATSPEYSTSSSAVWRSQSPVSQSLKHLSITGQWPYDPPVSHRLSVNCQSPVTHLSIIVSITCQFSVNRLSVTCQSTCQSLCQSPVNDRTTHLSVISCQLTVNLLSNLSIIYHFGNRLSKSFCQSPVKCMSTTCQLPAQSFSNHLTTTRHSIILSHVT